MGKSLVNLTETEGNDTMCYQWYFYVIGVNCVSLLINFNFIYAGDLE